MASQRIETILSAILTITAVVFAAVVVKREFFGSTVPGRTAPGPGPAPTYLGNWRDLVSDGISTGDGDAPIHLIEFIDLECPACKQFHQEILPDLHAKFGNQLAVTYLHFPLRIHRFAPLGARAVECAIEQDGLSDFLETAYAKQDSLGLKTWGSFAHEAGIADSLRFIQCVSGDRVFSRIVEGSSWAERLGLTATPTLIVNGWWFSIPPSQTELERVMTAVLDGDPPFEVPREVPQ